MAEIMDNSDFATTSEAFLTWLKSNGATISSRIQLADLRSSNAGRGIVATEDLAEDEEIFSIPRSSILTVETSSLPAAAKQEINDPWLSLIVAMVYEYLLGSTSPWKAYFDILPENFDSLMYWTEDDLEHLQGSAVIDKIGKEGADQTFTSQVIPILARYANTGNRSNEDLLALCHRMGSTIMAYAFDLENTSPTTPPRPSEQEQEQDGWEEENSEDSPSLQPKGMIPLADMLNADADHNNAKLFYSSNSVIMRTLSPIATGHQIYNDYGPLPRSDLLRRYGYITPSYTPYDIVEIPSTLIRERSKKHLRISAYELDQRWHFAIEQGILEEDDDGGYDISHEDSEEPGGHFPEEFRILLNLLATSKLEFEKLKKKDKLPKPEMSMDAKKLLRTILVYRYAMYPPESESMSVDEAGPGDRRRSMALQVIRGEKSILQEAVNAVSEAATPGTKKRSADTLEDEAAAIRNPGKR